MDRFPSNRCPPITNHCVGMRKSIPGSKPFQQSIQKETAPFHFNFSPWPARRAILFGLIAMGATWFELSEYPVLGWIVAVLIGGIVYMLWSTE